MDYVVELAEEAGSPTAEAAQSATRTLSLLEDGDRLPVFDRLLTGSDNLIWLRQYQPPWANDTSEAWIILASDGTPAGRLMLPGEIKLMHAGHGFVTGVTKDEFDVEYVTSLSIDCRDLRSTACTS
jgi:hypothetical protein